MEPSRKHSTLLFAMSDEDVLSNCNVGLPKWFLEYIAHSSIKY